MKITQLIAEPSIIKIVIDDETTLATYGESIEFYTNDYVSMTTYFAFFQARSEGNYEKITEIVKTLILNEDGEPVLKENQSLPIDIMALVVQHLGEVLGKQQRKTLTSNPGTLPE